MGRLGPAAADAELTRLCARMARGHQNRARCVPLPLAVVVDFLVLPLHVLMFFNVCVVCCSCCGQVWQLLVSLGVQERDNPFSKLPYPFVPQGIVSVEQLD